MGITNIPRFASVHPLKATLTNFLRLSDVRNFCLARRPAGESPQFYDGTWVNNTTDKDLTIFLAVSFDEVTITVIHFDND